MKTLKTTLAMVFLFLGLQSSAQSLVDGKYSSTFGNITMTTEYDKEFPNGSLIYGDYRENGTISGTYANFEKEIKGTFFNGSSEGKYIFIMPFALTANKPISTMNGFWGYTSDNKNDTNAANQWNITGKTGTSIAIKNETNVWSGTWNTTDGKMHLIQVGKNITGRYKGIGTVTAIYNPSTRLLKGTFLNQKINQKGYIEFYLEGNTFKGKWGWNSNMAEGNWDGTKDVENNKVLSKASESSSAQSSGTATTNNTVTKYSIRLDFMSTASKIGYVPGNEMYGFAGLRMFRVTSNGREEVKNFGNKNANFFDRTENNSFPNSKSSYSFPKTPEYIREFDIKNSELNNPNVDIEVEIWHHLKLKTLGKNDDYKYVKQVLSLERMIELKEVSVGKSCVNGVEKDFENSDIRLVITKS